MNKLALSVEEAAKVIGLGRNAAYEAIRRKEIPSLRIGGRILVPRLKLEEMFGGCGTPGAESAHSPNDRLTEVGVGL